MGSCLGRCLAGRKTRSFVGTEDDQDENLFDDNNSTDRSNVEDQSPSTVTPPQNNTATTTNTTNKSSIIFRIMKTKEKRHSKFIERFWARHEHYNRRYSRLNQYQITDSSGTTLNSIPQTINNQQSAIDESSEQTAIPLQCLNVQTLLHHPNHYQDLLTGNGSSPASSSLDLEWEHEYASGLYNHYTGWLRMQQNDCNMIEVSRNEDSDSSNRSTDEDSEDSDSSYGNSFEDGTNQHLARTNLPSKFVMNQRHRTDCQFRGQSSRTSWSHISTPESLEWDVDDDEQQMKSENDSLDNETMELLQEIEWLKNRALNETGQTITMATTTGTDEIIIESES